MNKKVWDDIKWLFNYVVSIIMYSIIILLCLIGIIILIYYIDVKRIERSGEWHPPMYGAYVIVSASMEPQIKINDAIIIKRVDSDNIKVGDVVTYKSLSKSYYGILITHRVVDIIKEDGETKYITKGDNNLTPDQNAVEFSQIYGKVVMRIPKIGYLQYFLSTSFGWILAIVIPCLAIISYDIFKLFKTISNNARNNKRKNREIKNER